MIAIMLIAFAMPQVAARHLALMPTREEILSTRLPFAELLGIKIVEATADKVRAEMRVRRTMV